MRAPAATAWSARRSVPESPSAGAGSSSSNRRSAGARNGSCAVSRVAHSASVVGSGAWKAAQALVAASSAAGAAGRREGQSVSSSLAVSSPRPANDGLPGKEPIDDQLGRGLLGVGEREHVEELELVVEVVLEPEHHLEAVAERLEQLPVAPLERGEQRLPAAPAAVGEEAGARPQQLLPRQRRHRPLVEHVLPGQHGAAERGLPQRVAGAFAVGDVEERRPRRRRPAAAGEVGGAAGAVVERGAGAADDACELVAHAPQRRDPRVDLVDLRRHPHPQRLRRRSSSGVPRAGTRRSPPA